LSASDDDLKWLMEQSHNTYLAWVALWLACMLGISNILIAIVSKPDVFIPLPHTILVFCVYVGLVVGMIFSIYRLSNVIKEHIIWAIHIKNKFLRRELLLHRGRLSRFIVDNDGRICKFNQFLVSIIHFGFSLLFFLLASA